MAVATAIELLGVDGVDVKRWSDRRVRPPITAARRSATADQGSGGPIWAGEYPGELDSSWVDLYADGRRGTAEPGRLAAGGGYDADETRAKPEEVAAASCKHNKRKSFSALISALLGEPVSAQPA
jgi:hypothetical protein